MTRARDSYEQDLLRSVKKVKATDEAKECGSLSCPEIGKIQPAANFYTRNGKLDSYCIICRRANSSLWKFNHPVSRATKGEKKTKWSLNLGKAPWCKDHRMNSSKCGCALGRYHRTPQHRAKIAAAMKGNKNAKGKKNKHGPLSAEHKLKISITMKLRAEALKRC